MAADEASRILGDELFLLLQSLVMAVQVRDAGAVLELEDYLAPKLDSAVFPKQSASHCRVPNSLR